MENHFFDGRDFLKMPNGSQLFKLAAKESIKENIDQDQYDY